jgi:hypothetical protein
MEIYDSSNVEYWQAIPTGYDHAVIILIPTVPTGKFQIQSQYKYARSLEAAERKADELKDVFKNYADSEALIIGREYFNRILKTQRSRESHKSKIQSITQLINESQGSHMSLALEDQTANSVKYLVYCLSDRQFAGAFDTAEQALSSAQDRSRSNPTKRYMVAAPSKLVYQPINVTVQDIDLSLPAEIA